MKKAFTLIEFLIVIIVIGVLAAAILPRTRSNSLQEGAMEFISAIKYTQHLAMISDKYDPTDPTWYQERWQFLYGKSNDTNQKFAISIFSDFVGTHSGHPDPVEIAVNPLNTTQLMSGGFSGTLNWEDANATRRLNLGETYGITNITRTTSCGAGRISFDNKGRPFTGDSSNWNSSTENALRIQCKFTIFKDSESIDVFIEPETGYIHL